MRIFVHEAQRAEQQTNISQQRNFVEKVTGDKKTMSVKKDTLLEQVFIYM